MRQSMRSSVLVLVALLSCISSYCHGVSGNHTGEQRLTSNEIALDRMQVFVKFENGSSFSLMMEPNDTVRDLSEDIWDYEGVPSDFARLRLVDHEPLDYDAKLFDSNIRAGTTVTLFLPKHAYLDTAEFNVTTLDGQVLRVQTQLGNSVASLKGNITQWTGIPQAEQRLLLKNRELKDERRLAQYRVRDGTQIDIGRPLVECNQAVTLYVKTLSGATIELEANLADTVAELKVRIANKTGVPASVQRLMTTQGMLSGNDRLCDLGLESGSVVYMYLYTSRIESPDQVARLQEPAHRAPIFREAEDARGSRRPAVSLFRDARNWIARGGPRPGWDLDRFDPVIYLDPNPDSAEWIKLYEESVEKLTRPGSGDSDRLLGELLRARIKLSSAVRPYRVAANLTSENQTKQQPGLSLAGRFAGALADRRQPAEPLATDVNNYAPDAFSDSDLMRLFEVCERVQRALTRAAHAGEDTLSIASQRRINNAILMTYLEALAGHSRSAESNQASGGAKCAICQDDLMAEPAIALTCEHKYHADCLLHWVTSSYKDQRFPNCPYCRQGFMFAYEALGKAELETESGLHGGQDEVE